MHSPPSGDLTVLDVTCRRSTDGKQRELARCGPCHKEETPPCQSQKDLWNKGCWDGSWLVDCVNFGGPLVVMVGTSTVPLSVVRAAEVTSPAAVGTAPADVHVATTPMAVEATLAVVPALVAATAGNRQQ